MLFALIIIIGLAVKGDTLMNMREYELFEIIGKLIESNSTKASEYLLAILPPLIVGILLAILGFVLDRNKQKNIDAVSEKTQLLSDKIDSQKTLIQALNSIETKNRENSMQIAKDLYKLFYSMYWDRVDKKNIANMFQDAKRYMYENSIYLDANIQNAFFAVLQQFAKIIVPGHPGEDLEGMIELNNKMNDLKNKLILEYNLL